MMAAVVALAPDHPSHDRPVLLFNMGLIVLLIGAATGEFDL